jgi:hypothetical protein
MCETSNLIREAIYLAMCDLLFNISSAQTKWVVSNNRMINGFWVTEIMDVSCLCGLANAVSDIRTWHLNKTSYKRTIWASLFDISVTKFAVES